MLTINTQKCETVHFGYTNPNIEYELNQIKIQSTEIFRDLGLKVDKKLTFRPPVDAIFKKSMKLINYALDSFTHKTTRSIHDLL